MCAEFNFHSFHFYIALYRNIKIQGGHQTPSWMPFWNIIYFTYIHRKFITISLFLKGFFPIMQYVIFIVFVEHGSYILFYPKNNVSSLQLTFWVTFQKIMFLVKKQTRFHPKIRLRLCLDGDRHHHKFILPDKYGTSLFSFLNRD